METKRQPILTDKGPLLPPLGKGSLPGRPELKIVEVEKSPPLLSSQVSQIQVSVLFGTQQVTKFWDLDVCVDTPSPWGAALKLVRLCALADHFKRSI